MHICLPYLRAGSAQELQTETETVASGRRCTTATSPNLLDWRATLIAACGIVFAGGFCKPGIRSTTSGASGAAAEHGQAAGTAGPEARHAPAGGHAVLCAHHHQLGLLHLPGKSSSQQRLPWQAYTLSAKPRGMMCLSAGLVLLRHGRCVVTTPAVCRPGCPHTSRPVASRIYRRLAASAPSHGLCAQAVEILPWYQQ